MYHKHQSFVGTQLNDQTALSLTIQFSISHLFALSLNVTVPFDPYIGPYLGQSGPGSNGDEEVLHILQSSNINEASPSDCLMSYPGHSLVGGWGSYPSAEMQLVYSTTPADRAGMVVVLFNCSAKRIPPFLKGICM